MKDSEVKIPNRKFETLRLLLDKWIEIHKDYSEIDDEDSLYWYNERANLSVLAGAAYRCNEFSLEEVRVDKEHGGDKWRGRCDLIFTWKKKDYAVESKQTTVSLGDRAKNASTYIKKSLGDAKWDAVGVKTVAHEHIGLVFAIPYIPEEQAEDTERLLERFIDEIDEVDYDLMAYVFPDSYRLLENTDGELYPGIVLFGRVPRRDK